MSRKDAKTQTLIRFDLNSVECQTEEMGDPFDDGRSMINDEDFEKMSMINEQLIDDQNVNMTEISALKK